jgi:hypothetical protein
MILSEPQFSSRTALDWAAVGAVIGMVLVYRGFNFLILPLCLVGGAGAGWLWAKIMWHSLFEYSLPKSSEAGEADTHGQQPSTRAREHRP